MGTLCQTTRPRKSWICYQRFRAGGANSVGAPLLFVGVSLALGTVCFGLQASLCRFCAIRHATPGVTGFAPRQIKRIDTPSAANDAQRLPGRREDPLHEGLAADGLEHRDEAHVRPRTSDHDFTHPLHQRRVRLGSSLMVTGRSDAASPAMADTAASSIAQQKGNTSMSLTFIPPVMVRPRGIHHREHRE